MKRNPLAVGLVLAALLLSFGLLFWFKYDDWAYETLEFRHWSVGYVPDDHWMVRADWRPRGLTVRRQQKRLGLLPGPERVHRWEDAEGRLLARDLDPSTEALPFEDPVAGLTTEDRRWQASLDIDEWGEQVPDEVRNPPAQGSIFDD